MPVAAILLAQRDIGSTVDGVHESLSSWDGCMAHSYCKWPVIAGIVAASLIVLSILWCLARCLCCGLQCCCGCLSCFNACCPSPRGRNRDRGAYQQAPPTPYQYQQPPPMQPPAYMTGGAGGAYRGAPVASTATFDAPSKKFNEDALPAMPSWQNAQSRRVESDEEVELEKMDHTSPTHTSPEHQQDAFVANSQDNFGTDRYNSAQSGDLGASGMHANPYNQYSTQQPQHYPASPYGNQTPYDNQGRSHNATGYFTGAQTSPSPHEQAPPSPYGAQNTYNNNPAELYSPNSFMSPVSPNQYRSPMAGGFHTAGRASPLSYAPTTAEYYDRAQQPSYAPSNAYEPSTAPSYEYHTEVPMASPLTPPALTPGRKPVNGGWREV